MRLIVNADDFGMNHEKNIAVDKMMKDNICTNASLVVNTPYSQEAVDMAFANGYQNKLSLHINLTIGEPLSNSIKKYPLYYEKGAFAYHPIIKSKNQIYPFHIKSVQEEIEAQFIKFIGYGLNLKSVDSHNWVHLRLPIWLSLKPLISKYNIKIVRPMWIGYKKDIIASKKWAKYFRFVEPILLKNPACQIFEHTSNIEQFLINENNLKAFETVEVFTHPDLIDGQILDVSSSYLRKPYSTVVNNVRLLDRYSKATINEIIEDKNL